MADNSQPFIMLKCKIIFTIKRTKDQAFKLAKSIQDASFSSFCNMIDYKSKWYGRTYINVGSFYPSSKLCHCCGYKNTTLTLTDRKWECPNCHTLLDRDKNAAINILEEGLKILNKSGQELPTEPIDTVHDSALE